MGSRTPAKNPDRFYEEFDYDRRLKKRKTKLLAATEEAFAHLARVCEERIKGISALWFLKKCSARPKIKNFGTQNEAKTLLFIFGEFTLQAILTFFRLEKKLTRKQELSSF